MHDAEQVDVDDPPPVLERGVDDGPGVADPGVVEQQVDRAVGVVDLGGEPLDGRRRRTTSTVCGDSPAARLR